MAYNRFEQYVPIQWNLPKTDLGVLAGVLESKQKRFDTGYELANQLSKTSIEALPQDRARANELMLEWEAQKKNIVDSYSGDYSSAYRDLRRLEADMTKQLSPGGEANAIAANKKAFADWYATAAKDKEVNPDTLNAAYSYYMSPEGGGYFKGTGKQDPITGNYSVFNPEQILPSINPDDVVLPAIKELEAEGYEREYDQISGMWKLRHKETGKEVSYDRVFNTALNSLTTNDKYMPFLGQSLKFKGITDLDAQGTAAQLADTYAKNFSYGTNSKSTTMDANQVALHFDTEARKDARQNQMLGSIGDMFNPQKGYMDYSANMMGKELTLAELDPSKLRYSGENKGWSPYIGYEAYQEKARMVSGDIKNRSTLITQLENGEFQRLGGNKAIMELVVKENPSLNSEQLLAQYNKSLKEVGQAKKPAMKVFDNKTGEIISQQMLQSGAGQFTTIRVQSTGGQPTEITYQDFMNKYGSEIYDDKGNVKPQYKTMNTMVDASAGVNPSFVFKVGKETIFMEAPPAYVQAMKPVTDLSQAYTNPNGEAITTRIPGLESRDRNGKLLKDWRNTPVKQVVAYRKVNGQTVPVPQLYEWNKSKSKPEGEWKPATFLFDNPRTNKVEEYPLTLDMIELGLDEVAFPENFGTIQQTAKNTFYNSPFGDKIRTED